ncbi:hypothetical protein [Metaplanococcus flavidus]|uniref:Uncharacterized protein n=1 Tax=Metaplanococcus flavidus TaxID=569883 RepID=A0ABW3LCP4_9BACL
MMFILLLIIGSYVMGLLSFIFVRLKKNREIKKVFLDPYDEITKQFVRIENHATNQTSFKGKSKKNSGGYMSDSKGTDQDDMDFALRDGVYSDSMSYDSNDTY